MQVEKVGSKKQPAKQDPLKSFNEQVVTLWEEHLRTALIFHRPVRFCMDKNCLTFYDEQDPEHNHPIANSQLLENLFNEAGINCVMRLAHFLWCLSRNLTVVGENARPLYSPKHNTAQLSPVEMDDRELILSLYTRIESLQVQLFNEASKRDLLEEQKKQLAEQNSQCFIEIVKLRANHERDINQIERLAAEIGKLCHSEDCPKRCEEKPSN